MSTLVDLDVASPVGGAAQTEVEESIQGSALRGKRGRGAVVVMYVSSAMSSVAAAAALGAGGTTWLLLGREVPRNDEGAAEWCDEVRLAMSSGPTSYWMESTVSASAGSLLRNGILAKRRYSDPGTSGGKCIARRRITTRSK